MVSKTIIKEITGNVTISSFDAGDILPMQTSSFDNYIQIIDGAAGLVINEKRYTLGLGEGIIIPAHAKYCFSADKRFKMITTIIKSSYED